MATDEVRDVGVRSGMGPVQLGGVLGEELAGLGFSASGLARA
ncbi:MAG: hypothetical protein OXG64_05875 [Chloroflexi bacterium]|nr:hypothetical protein [Chloroflexota bacterium]MCY3957221.1 hypothetical protein [Chloroflexota bacterium]